MDQLKADPGQWVELHADYLYAYAIKRVGDREQANDLVQDTFLAGLECINKFQGKSSERTWLTAILRNKIFDVYRKRQKQCVTLLREDLRHFDLDPSGWKKGRGPELLGVEHEDPLLNKELKAVLQNCLQKLPPLWRSVFSRKCIDDEPTKTICSDLNISDANLWVIIHRSKLNLRTSLQRAWF